MLDPRPHLCNRCIPGNPGHNRNMGPNSGTVPAIPGQLATMLLCFLSNSNIIMHQFIVSFHSSEIYPMNDLSCTFGIMTSQNCIMSLSIGDFCKGTGSSHELVNLQLGIWVFFFMDEGNHQECKPHRSERLKVLIILQSLNYPQEMYCQLGCQ